MIAHWFVSRRADGAIASAHEEPEEDAAMERLAAEDPELVAFFARAYPLKPIVVSRLRLKLELLERGLLDKVAAAVNAAGPVAMLYWAEAFEIESDHALVGQIGAAIGLKPDELRALFAAAAARVA